MNINENFKKEGKSLEDHTYIDFLQKPSFMYVVISKMIQFDKFFHPVVLYENHLICIFMNIYENSKNDGKIIGKKKVSNDQELGPWG